MKKILFFFFMFKCLVIFPMEQKRCMILIKNSSHEAIRIKFVKETTKYFDWNKTWTKIGKTIQIAQGGGYRVCFLDYLEKQNKKFLQEFKEDKCIRFLIVYSREKNKKRMGLQYWGNYIDISGLQKSFDDVKGLMVKIKTIEKNKKEENRWNTKIFLNGNKSLSHTHSIIKDLRQSHIFYENLDKEDV